MGAVAGIRSVENMDADRVTAAAGLSADVPAEPPTEGREGLSDAEHQRERNRRAAPIIPDAVPWRAVIAFVVIALGLAWAVASPLWISGDGLAHPAFQFIALGMMYTPTIAALVVVFFIARPRSIPRQLGLSPLRPVGRTVGLTAAAFVGFPVLAFLAMLLGDAMGLIRLDLVGLSGLAELIAAQGGEELDPAGLRLAAVGTLLFIPVNIIVSSLAAFGEELGWRGWLLPNLMPLGTWPALATSGVIWGVWHAPLILLGYNYLRTDAVGVLMMVGWCVLLGALIGWLRLRSASVWPAVVAHGAVNGSVTALGVLIAADTPDLSVFGTLLGWSGWIVLAVVILLLVVTGQFRRDKLRGALQPAPATTLAAGGDR